MDSPLRAVEGTIASADDPDCRSEGQGRDPAGIAGVAVECAAALESGDDSSGGGECACGRRANAEDPLDAAGDTGGGIAGGNNWGRNSPRFLLE